MQRQTKLIVERFTNLEDILYSPARWDSGNISLFNRTEQVFFRLACFFLRTPIHSHWIRPLYIVI